MIFIKQKRGNIIYKYKKFSYKIDVQNTLLTKLKKIEKIVTIKIELEFQIQKWK